LLKSKLYVAVVKERPLPEMVGAVFLSEWYTVQPIF
jgi:hypothetical protein